MFENMKLKNRLIVDLVEIINRIITNKVKYNNKVAIYI